MGYFPSMSTLRTTKIKVAVKRYRHITSILDYVNTINCTIPMGRNGRGVEGGLLPVQGQLCLALFPASSKQT